MKTRRFDYLLHLNLACLYLIAFEKHPSKSAGKVYAIDPSSDLLIDMVNIANENSISNICTRMTFIGSTSDGKFAKIDDMDIDNLGLLHLDLEGKVRVSIFVSCEFICSI